MELGMHAQLILTHRQFNVQYSTYTTGTTYFSSSHSGLQSTTLTPLTCLTLVHTMPTSAVSMAGTQA